MRYSSAVRCGKAIKQLLSNKDDNFWVLLFNSKERYDNPIISNVKRIEEISCCGLATSSHNHIHRRFD